jgi:ATP-dependent DNA helicase PIF1
VAPNDAMLLFMKQTMARKPANPKVKQVATPIEFQQPTAAAKRMIQSNVPMRTGVVVRTEPAPQASNTISGVDISDLGQEQFQAIADIMNGKNVLITGPAGTGKSFTINKLRQILGANNIRFAVTSTTGKSAIIIGGKTIHSFAGIKISKTKDSALKLVMASKPAQKRIIETQALIIDEVSMLSGDMIDILDYVFRMVRNRQEPFGGMQIILSGDFYQLRPVKSETYAFESSRWNFYIHAVHELTQIFRQEDKTFCTALNEVRVGAWTQSTIELFDTCINRQFNSDIKPTELYPVNEYVDSVNTNELLALASEENMIVTLGAHHDFVEKPKPRYERDQLFKGRAIATMNKNCIAPEVLELVIGAQVMLTKNIDVEAGLANGSRGVVVGFTSDSQPIVKFVNDIQMPIQSDNWYMWVNDTCKIVRTQFPLKLAWAMSIHKSQGATLDMAKIDLGDRVFGEGMIYVALSRVRSIEGLCLLAIDWDNLRVSQKVKDFYESCRQKKIAEIQARGPNILRNM